MSDAKKESGEASPKKKGKLMLFVGIGVLVLAIGGAAAVFLLKKPHAEDGEDGEDAPVKEEKAAKKKETKHEPPVFVKLDPFTVRLQNDGQDSYLQATPELRVLDLHTGDAVKQYMPEIRHKALLIIASKTPGEVNNPKGVEKLSNQLRVVINQVLEPPPPPKKGKKKEEPSEELSEEPADPSDPIQAVLFTSFIVQ